MSEQNVRDAHFGSGISSSRNSHFGRELTVQEVTRGEAQDGGDREKRAGV